MTGANAFASRIEASFDSKTTVKVRCGGRGQELIGKDVHAKTKNGEWKTVRLVKLVEDYGPGDVCVFTFSWK